MNKDPDYKHIAWCDIETTGLDPALDTPLEIAIVLTGLDLDVIAERTWLVLPPQLDVIALPTVVRTMHNENGLFRDIFDAQDALRERDKRPASAYLDSRRNLYALPESELPAERIDFARVIDHRIDDWLRAKLGYQWHDYGHKRTLALGGSGVSHFEARWLPLWFPKFNEWLHHSTLDVGVLRRFIENVANRPKLVPQSTRTLEHRAMDDVQMHLREGRKYLDVIAKSGATPQRAKRAVK